MLYNDASGIFFRPTRHVYILLLRMCPVVGPRLDLISAFLAFIIMLGKSTVNRRNVSFKMLFDDGRSSS